MLTLGTELALCCEELREPIAGLIRQFGLGAQGPWAIVDGKNVVRHVAKSASIAIRKRLDNQSLAHCTIHPVTNLGAK